MHRLDFPAGTYIVSTCVVVVGRLVHMSEGLSAQFPLPATAAAAAGSICCAQDAPLNAPLPLG